MVAADETILLTKQSGKHCRWGETFARGAVVQFGKFAISEKGVCPGRAGVDVHNLQRSWITDQKRGTSDDLVIDSCSLATGRRACQDPMQYINGANTYQFVMSNPVGKVDASGLAPGFDLSYGGTVNYSSPAAQRFLGSLLCKAANEFSNFWQGLNNLGRSSPIQIGVSTDGKANVRATRGGGRGVAANAAVRAGPGISATTTVDSSGNVNHSIAVGAGPVSVDNTGTATMTTGIPETPPSGSVGVNVPMVSNDIINSAVNNAVQSEYNYAPGPPNAFW